VPWFWVTGDGNLETADEETDDPLRPLVFPSIDPGETAPGIDHASVGKIFRSGNRFRKKRFEWRALNGEEIEFSLTRTQDDQLQVSAAPTIMHRIRSLHWFEFRQLEGSFKEYLLDHSGCWIFEDCEGRFEAGFQQTLAKFWREKVLTGAALGDFAGRYLDQYGERNFPVTYSDDAGKGIDGLKHKSIAMHATAVGPGQVLAINWGATTVYPSNYLILSNGFTRPSTGGETQITIAEEDGPRLFPRGVPTALPIPEDSGWAAKPATALPFPMGWSGLISGNQPTFLPVETYLDLHDKRLLKPVGANPPARHLFLLTPELYVKADTDQISQFKTDERSQELTTAQKVGQLSRRFTLVGCRTAEHSCVQEAMMALLDQAYLTSDAAGVTGSPTNPSYTAAVFTNQTTVQLRHHISFNGQPAASTARDGETWGVSVWSWAPSLMERYSRPGTSALLEIRRTLHTDATHAETRQMIFYTTPFSLLNQIRIFEGDEFRAADLSALPR
jgi:hypothetical protein